MPTPPPIYQPPRYPLLGAARILWLLGAVGALLFAVLEAFYAVMGVGPSIDRAKSAAIALLSASILAALADLARWALDIEEYARSTTECAHAQLDASPDRPTIR